MASKSGNGYQNGVTIHRLQNKDASKSSSNIDILSRVLKYKPSKEVSNLRRSPTKENMQSDSQSPAARRLKTNSPKHYFNNQKPNTTDVSYNHGVLGTDPALKSLQNTN